jgi:CheY-like chemotaxis protein/anti-sigma regulatory factor (Ser/Thr protein kinase)
MQQQHRDDLQSAARILVVEDDRDLCNLLSTLLDVAGYSTDTACDGGNIVERVAAERPDAVVLDVMLPDRSGFDICRDLKFRRDTNLIPIVMLTAMQGKDAEQSGFRVGANRYLNKPFEPDDLLNGIREALDHRRQLEAGRTHTAIEIQMNSDSRNREQLNDLLSELFVLTPLSDEDVGKIRYAALEMIENAMEWGNRRRSDLMVTVAYEVTDDQVKFVITDQGQGFDPKTLQHAACDEDPCKHLCVREKLGLRDGGFGMMIARGIMDEVRYNERGNQVTLIKYFDGRKKQPA